MDRCPKCGGETGYCRKLRTSYEQHYDWDGNPSYAADGKTYGGRRAYCLECARILRNILYKPNRAKGENKCQINN